MAHYFSQDNDTLKSNPKEIAFRVNGVPLTFKTDYGVFSKDGFDRGTEVMLKFLTIEDTIKSALDLGCGYGVVGTYLSKVHNLEVDMVDINKRAIELSEHNVRLNNAKATVFMSDGFSEINKSYDLIITNPPIRTGKQVIYKFFRDAKEHLTEFGKLVIVINKKHGANSAIKYLQSIYETVEDLGNKKGFHVISCRK